MANGTVAKSLPENQSIAWNALLQRVVAFLSKETEIFCLADDFRKFFDTMTAKHTLKTDNRRKYHRDSPMRRQIVNFEL